jgi:hypothetical protein
MAGMDDIAVFTPQAEVSIEIEKIALGFHRHSFPRRSLKA